VHLEFGNKLSNVDVSWLVAIEAQVVDWRPHNYMSKYVGDFLLSILAYMSIW
jgi:hypothetical protein